MIETTLDEVKTLLGGDYSKCESPSLRLEKFVHLGGNTKKDEIDAVVKCQSSYSKKRAEGLLPANADRFLAKLKSRLIVNQAGGILENAGLCLHPYLGYPYIPGSAVKGVARHMAWCEWRVADESQKEEVARNIAKVFGYPTGDKKGLDDYLAKLGQKDCGGCISFWVAEPVEKVKLVTEIVTCHHAKYYQGDRPGEGACDDEAPNPQFFPAVEEGGEFMFTLVPLRDAGSAELALAKKWLIKAIEGNGIGAKTSAGYGWFGDIDECTKRYQEKKCKEEELAEKEARQKESESGLSELEAMEDKSSPEFVQRFTAFDKKVQELSPQNQERLNKLRKLLPQKSLSDEIRDKWAGKSVEECLLATPYIRDFKLKSEKEKKVIVDILRKHEVWQYLRKGDFKDIPKKHQKNLREQVEAIRAFAKTTSEGKMP